MVCRACGRFRKEKIKPITGDMAVFSMQGSEGYIEQIEERKNCLKRPEVANIDLIVLTMCKSKPIADLLLADKLLIQAQKNNADVLICINKTDEENSDFFDKQYTTYDIIKVSAKTGANIDALKEKIKGKCVCFCGQSAVGKSSIINAINGDELLKTGDLSAKTDRGKHTTRLTELYYIKDLESYIIDTPGFSMFEMGEIENLKSYYKEFEPYAKNCRFNECKHENEPNCRVKEAVENKEISELRYKRYITLLNSLEDKYD